MRRLLLLLFSFGLLIWPAACRAGDATVTPPPGDAAAVTRVIDGDTIEVELNGRSHRVRYIGVDSPERDEPFYAEAAATNRALVEGRTVILVKDVSETDRYGRLLRYVYLEDGLFVNAELLRQGYAQIVTFPPDVARHDALRAIQREARAAGRGLWSLPERANLPPGCDTCDRNAYNCADFPTQAAAQACYDACLALTGVDVHRLDGGGTGVACKSLP